MSNLNTAKIIFLVWMIFSFLMSDISTLSGWNQYEAITYSKDVIGFSAIINLMIWIWVTYVLYPREN